MKVKAQICFCNFRKVQGWRWWLIRLFTFSKHTHAHLEFNGKHPFTFVVVDHNHIKTIRLKYLENLGVTTYFSYPLGEIDISEEDIFYAMNYPKVSSVKMIWYQLVGRFFGMRRPESCITFICDFLRTKGFDTPDLFSPKQLMENLTNDDHYVRWSSPSRKDNAGQVAQ